MFCAVSIGVSTLALTGQRGCGHEQMYLNTSTTRLTQFHRHFLKSWTYETVTPLEERAEFLHEGVRAKRETSDGRILLGDNIGGGAIVLRPIRFQWAGVCVSNGLPLTNLHVCWVRNCAKFDLCRNFRNETTAQFGKCLYKHTVLFMTVVILSVAIGLFSQ
jgi:hypothetical protein